MNAPQEPGGDRPAFTDAAMDLPERAGWCAFGGGYVKDGTIVCYFGREFICNAPNLEPTENDC